MRYGASILNLLLALGYVVIIIAIILSVIIIYASL